MVVRTASDIAADETCIRAENWVGRITLNRPKSINALTFRMVQEIANALTLWRHDPAVRAVVFDGEGERGFCAGGDIRALYDHRAQPSFLTRYWREEYILDHAIRTYPKPIVALMNGLTMGGGAGLGVNASHRIVDETTRFGMPETGIGLVPDVGATWFLPRCPGQTGVWLAMTGEAIGAGDMLALGLANAFCERSKHEDFVVALSRELGKDDDPRVAIERALAGFWHSVESPLTPQRETILRCFAAHAVEDILAALDADGDDWALKAAAKVREKSPLMQKVALRALRLGEGATDVAACLATEFRIVSRVAVGHEFFEGVRAAIVDKDRTPRWRPARLEEVTDALVESFFEPLGEELNLPPSQERFGHD
jgi:enoyl-CoA hydratase